LRLRGPVVLYQPREREGVMPLGLLHLGSALSGQPVVIVDGRLDLAPEARVAGLAREALCLGVTVRSGRNIGDALRVSRAVRAANPELPIVWGGGHPTVLPEQCLGSEVVDACAIGAGEETLGELVAALRAERASPDLAGLAWRRGDKVVIGPLRAPADAARAPRADYRLLDLEHYFRVRGARRLDYCSSRRPWPIQAPPQPAWSGLPAQRVVAELRDLVGPLRVTEVSFQDEDFFAEPRRAEAIARGLLEAAVPFAWSAAGSAAALGRMSPEAFRALAASGCSRVDVRPPAETVLGGEEAEAILEAARRLRTAGIGGRFAFTAGFPGRGPAGLAEIHRLILALRRIDPHCEAPIWLHAPHPGPPGAMPPDFPVPERLEGWVEAGLEVPGRWVPSGLRRRASRLQFFLGEAGRPPGGRIGKRLLRLVARVRVRLGFYGLDLERHAVEWSARIRTGRSRPQVGARD
jgi:hypothetical protein